MRYIAMFLWVRRHFPVNGWGYRQIRLNEKLLPRRTQNIEVIANEIAVTPAVRGSDRLQVAQSF